MSSIFIGIKTPQEFKVLQNPLPVFVFFIVFVIDFDEDDHRFPIHRKS